MPRKGAVDKFVVCRDTEAVTHLEPGLFPAGRQAEWSSQNRTLTFSIHPLNNKIALAVAGKQASASLAKRVPVFGQDQAVHICGPGLVADSRLSFIYDTHAVFSTLQRVMEAASTGEERVGIDSLLRMSTVYREAMLRQLRVLQGGAQTEAVAAEIDTFQSMQAVWHLLEIIYLTTNLPGLSTSIVPYFLDWVNFNFPAPSADAGQRIIESSAAGADSLVGDAELWPYIKRLALRGHVLALANMLERLAPAQGLSAAAGRWARDIARIARDMPLGSAEETAGSFSGRWRRWHEELQSAATAIGSLLPAGGSDDSEGWGGGDDELEALYVVVDILRGNADAIATEGESWLDVVSAVLLYSEPTAQADRLPALASVVAEQFPRAEFSVVDRALFALLSHDLAEFLVFCNQIDPWLAAHITDLMDHISILDQCRVAFAVDPRSHYLVALGEAYVAHEGLWRVGLDYLGLCGTRAARCVMAECAVRVPLESDTKAQQVLRVCSDYGLAQAADRIHRQLGRQQWLRGRLGAAIGHFAQVADNASIARICDQLWAQYLASGELAYGPVIDGVMALGLRHDRVQFLTRYRDFYESYRARELVGAGLILLGILVAEIAPPHAVPDLLVDAIPLLEGDALVFSSDQTFELMRCAEGAAMDEGEQSIFNVACARNLARSFVST